ncbi:ArnT family glycosyltransferase [Candidatus Latescibacterota bacterium]
MKKKRLTNKYYNKNTVPKKKKGLSQRLIQVYDRCEPWFPWVLAVIYFGVMSYYTFRYHKIGRLGVETDFYVELVPQAKKLLSGQFSPLNYGAKGPLYSLLLSGMYLVIRDYFNAGLLLNLMSSGVFLITVYFLVKMMFNSITAVLVMFAVSTNFVFQSYTFRAGSDMPFMALCVLSMYFLFRERGIRDIALSALCGVCAFLTRYNGAFIAMGAMFYLALVGGSMRERMKRTGIWIGIFILAGLPWFVPNWVATGSPVYNENYINVMLEFYALGEDGVMYDNWTDALPKQFTSLGDIFFYNPIHFFKSMTMNVFKHFFSDMRDLLGWGIGIFVILGFIMFWFESVEKKKLVYFSFGLFYFLILTLVFYNLRFSLILLVFYVPLAVWPFTVNKKRKFSRYFSYTAIIILSIVLLNYSYNATSSTLNEIKNPPAFLNELKDLGVALKKTKPDTSKKITARVPHVAYFSGLDFTVFPVEPETVEDLVEVCMENDIAYVVYTGIEADARPKLRVLLNVDQKHPGLEKVHHNRFGVVYRVIDGNNN